MLCVAATTAAGYDVLGTNWKIATDIAAERGAEMDRSRLRLVGPVHLAPTREQAFKNVKFGLKRWIEYFTLFNPAAVGDAFYADDPAVALVESGWAVIGTPEDAIAQIGRLREQSGGFGCFLHLAHNWADWEHTLKSAELWAIHRTSAALRPIARRRPSGANVNEFMTAAANAAQQMFMKHAEEEAAKAEQGIPRAEGRARELARRV
jgi:limonene 1,2-monooxygenase